MGRAPVLDQERRSQPQRSGAGEPVISTEFGLDPSTPGGSGIHFGNVRYVRAISRQGYWFKSTGALYEFGGRWRISSAILAAVCWRTDLPDPDGNFEGGNGSAYLGPSEAIPEGEDPTAQYYYTAMPWLEGTLRVFVDGELLQPGVDYAFSVEEQWIKFPAGFDDDTLYVRYYPR